jgi:hypothetical protein
MAFQATKLSALIVVSILSTTAALANEQGWVFTQRSAQLGDQYVYLSQSGLRLINPNSGIGITAHTPAWDVDYFNEKTRLYFREPLGDWKKGRTINLAINTWKKAQSGKIAGLKATKFLAVSPKANKTDWSSAEYWIADGTKVPQQLTEVLAGAYGVPSRRALPLRVIVTYKNGKSATLLDTYRQQAVAIPEDYYSLPSSYVIAKNPQQVLETVDSRLTTEMAGQQASVVNVTDTGSPSRPQLDLGRWRPGQPVTKALRDKYHKYLNALQKARAEEEAKDVGNQ